MKKSIFILIFIIITFVSLSYAQKCDGELTIFMQFRDFQIESESGFHSYPNFVQGDLLQINKIFIKNLGKCDSPPLRFNFILKKRSGEEIKFCTADLLIDSIEPEASNVINYYGNTFDVNHGLKRVWLGYKDLNDKKYKWCGHDLIEPGIWTIEKDIQFLNVDSDYKILLSVLDEDDKLRHTGFTVYSANELEIVSDTKKLVKLTVVLTWLTVIMAIIAVLQIITSIETVVKYFKKIRSSLKKK